MKRALLVVVCAALLGFAFTASARAEDDEADEANETIKIGVATSLTGDLAPYGVPTLNASRVVVDKVNAEGGINGRMLELVVGDDQCRPEFGTNVATRLISDGVAAVIGHICSGPTKAALPLYNEAKIVTISPAASTPVLTNGDNPMFFRTIARDSDQAKLTSRFMLEKLDVKKVAYIHDNGVYGKGFCDSNRELLEFRGVETVLFEAITPDAVDFSPIVRKLRRANADVIVFGGYMHTASKLLQQMRRDRVYTTVIGPDSLQDKDFVRLAGKAAEGVYCSYPKDMTSLPISKEARKAHLDTFNSEPGSFYYNAYSAMLALVNALKVTNSTDTDKLVEALHTNTVATPVGNIVFSETGDASGLAHSIYVIKDGKCVETDFSVTLD